MVTKLINSKLSISNICRLNFLAWNHCQESYFNSEIAVDGWDCLKGSRHRVSHVVCEVQKHLAVSPSCWKPVCSVRSVDTTALILTFSHVNALCNFISFLCILLLFILFPCKKECNGCWNKLFWAPHIVLSSLQVHLQQHSTNIIHFLNMSCKRVW